ncbi:hypothetical protein ACPCHT_02140 [Nucisporomicrobium flavum]|jgi:hypothetical protein|uniref:hypothetical protein n=1 Tax=Nucisporomicrobium flavum TaxID=2785915 RepID=UPI0018F63F99|nr:hypothetical protein [Nucisporomicrobium flavum]
MRDQERERAVKSREDYRHLPPRVTPEQIVPVKPVVHPVFDPTDGDDDQWNIRHGWTG